jgi:hypothetical protein
MLYTVFIALAIVLLFRALFERRRVVVVEGSSNNGVWFFLFACFALWVWLRPEKPKSEAPPLIDTPTHQDERANPYRQLDRDDGLPWEDERDG